MNVRQNPGLRRVDFITLNILLIISLLYRFRSISSASFAQVSIHPFNEHLLNVNCVPGLHRALGILSLSSRDL